MVSVRFGFLYFLKGFEIFLFRDLLAGEEAFFFIFLYFAVFLLGWSVAVFGLLFFFFGHAFSPFAPLFSAK